MRVFISTHQGDELTIAQVLRHWIKLYFRERCEVFLCSDDVAAGDKWLDRLHKALSVASVMLVLCDKSVAYRPWIAFEVGCGWLKGMCVIPICHSGQRPQHLPVTLSTYQGLSLDDADFVHTFVPRLAAALNESEVPHIDEGKMHQELTRVYSEYRRKQRRIEVRVDRGCQSWPAGVVLSFHSGSQRDLIEDLASIANLNPDTFGVSWHLRHENGKPLERREGLVSMWRAFTGVKHSLILTIETERTAFRAPLRPDRRLRPARARRAGRQRPSSESRPRGGSARR
jgi:hypothetical protein